MFVPIDLMRRRIETDRADSDTTLFFTLLYYGEFLFKLATVALVSSLPEETERHRYRYLHRLVRADGIGDWGKVLDEALTGPSSALLPEPLRDEQRELTQKTDSGAWQNSMALAAR